MHKKLNLFFLLLFFIAAEVSAQTKKAELQTFKYGKVDLKEFDVKGTGADSAAAAVKIFDVGKGSFEVSPQTHTFVYIFERHVRYKIVNKNAYELADLEIPLYVSGDGSQEKLESIKAATYNLNNNVIETSKMANDAKFSNRLDKKHIVKKFTFPNVKEGSIIEYTYKTKSDFTFRLDDWYFQGEYPCQYSCLTMTIPEHYDYKIAAEGYVNIYQLNPVEALQTYVIPSGTAGGQDEKMTVNSQKKQFYAEHIPAIKSESFITTIEDYISKISFELRGTNFPGSSYKDYTSNWKKIIAEMMSHENFGGYIKKSKYDKNLLSSIIKDEKDPEAKMNLIFNYVKNNIKWDGKYGMYAEATNQKTILEKKSGNLADINLLLFSLLDAENLSCSPVLISTRNNGAHPGYPMATKFNSVVVAVTIGEKTHLLDATSKNNVCDLISYQNLNHKGLKIDPVSGEAAWISTENAQITRKNIFYNLKLDKDNKFTGTLALSYDNYDGVGRRSSYLAATNEAEFIKDYKKGKQGLEISNYKIGNLDQASEPLEETMDVTIEDNIEDAGNMSYFTPLLFERTEKNPFRLEERNYPVDFGYPNEEVYRIAIEFPEEYKLDKLPKGEKLVLPNNDGTFIMNYFAEGNKIVVISKITIAKSVFTADEYYNLKELFKNIVRKQAEQIIFKKS